MWVMPGDTRTPGDLAYLIRQALDASRFTATVDTDALRGRVGVKVSRVRLRKKKDYCGNHPGPCLARRGDRHLRTRYLEGLDWVGYNALLNDAFDKLSVACTAFSFNTEARCGKYFVRRGRLRRVRYPFRYESAGGFPVALWHQDAESLVTDFADYCGQPPPDHDATVADSGTPGYPCYTVEEEDQYRAEEVCV